MYDGHNNSVIMEESINEGHQERGKKHKSLIDLQNQSQQSPNQSKFTKQRNTIQQNPDTIDSLNQFSPELQSVLKRIISNKFSKKQDSQINWKNQISAASKKINIPKNIQNKIYIKAAISQDKVQKQKERIRKYMKENHIDIMHLNEINSVFLDCDLEGKGFVPKNKFLIALADQNLQFPADFLFNLIMDMQVDSNDEREEAVLQYENLQNIIEIFNNCPTLLRGDNNNSDNFKANLDLNKDLNAGNYDRIDKLFQYVHARIEEKFKDFRIAFRSFDKNFDGSLNFKEFITGMEGIGVKLKLSDYRLIFDAIDYDGEAEIDFSKFCLLNTDRKQDLQKLKQQHQLAQQSQHNTNNNSKKPPLPFLQVQGSSSHTHTTQQSEANHSSIKGNKLFGDGNIPKNKDMSSFTKDIQSTTLLQTYLKKRFRKTEQKQGLKSYSDMPNSHIYGRSLERDHDMVAILTNSYQDELKRSTIDELRNNLALKRVIHSKPTTSQMLRDQVNRNKINNRSLNLTGTQQIYSESRSLGGSFTQNQQSAKQNQIPKQKSKFPNSLINQLKSLQKSGSANGSLYNQQRSENQTQFILKGTSQSFQKL